MPLDTSIDTFMGERQGDKEPLLSFKWKCTALPFGMSVYQVEGVQIPWIKVAVKEGHFGAATYSYYPGFSDIDQFSVTFMENSRADVQAWIWDWKRRIKDYNTGAYFLPNNYKADLQFVMMDTRGSPVLTVDLIGCWPSQRSEWDLNYTDGNSHVTTVVQFSCDDQNLTWHK